MQLSKKNIFGIVVLLVLIVSVRLFEKSLFYDPLLQFFKLEGKVLPQYESLKLFAGLTFRYLLNSALSLGVIYLFFKDIATVRAAALLFAVFYIILIIAVFLVLNADSPNLMLLFYIRRFLIQPLFLILFVPAFYYQKKMR